MADRVVVGDQGEHDGVLLGYVVVTNDYLGWCGGGPVHENIETAREELRRLSKVGIVCLLASLTREHGGDDVSDHPVATELRDG